MDVINQEESIFYKKGEIKIKTIWSFWSILFYKLALDLSYYYIISPVWGYMKFESHFNIIKLFESLFLLFLIFSLMPKSSRKLSNVMVWLFILFSYVPMLTLFALKDESRLFMYAVTGFWLMVFLLLDMPRISLPSSLREAGVIRLSLFILLSLIALLITYRYLGFSLNFDLTKVYEIRSKYVEAEIPLAGYLFNWAAYIVNPLFFALFCVKKKWIFVSFIVCLQLFLFSTTGHKTFLFALIMASALMWIVTRRNPLGHMTIGLAGIIFLGMLSYWLIGDVWISSLFARRTLLDQPQQYFFYYDFFSNHDFTFLSQHRIFNIFTNYPYQLDPPNLIGKIYYGSPQNNANTGIVGDAYMNFGFAGLALWGIILVVILKLVDSCSNRVDIRVGVAAIAMPTITLINSALLTNLLTHGLLLSLLLLYLLPKWNISSGFLMKKRLGEVGLK